MKLKINTEIEILEDKNNICETFKVNAEETAYKIIFYWQKKRIKNYAHIIIELLKENRIDMICTLATACIAEVEKHSHSPNLDSINVN